MQPIGMSLCVLETRAQRISMTDQLREAIGLTSITLQDGRLDLVALDLPDAEIVALTGWLK